MLTKHLNKVIDIINHNNVFTERTYMSFNNLPGCDIGEKKQLEDDKGDS